MTDYRFHETENALHRSSEIKLLRLSNGIYDVSVFYYGDYENDRKNGTVDRNNITVSCRGKADSLPLDCCADGTVYIKTDLILPMLTPGQAAHLKELLDTAAESAAALQEALKRYF